MAGEAANNVEETSEKEVVDKLMKVMSRIAAKDKTPIPPPIHVAITRWGSDPLAGGSYSYIKVGGTGEDYDLLAEPVGKRLYFAGEATSREHPATTGGAFLSGLREASKIACQFGRIAQVTNKCSSDCQKLSAKWNFPERAISERRKRVAWELSRKQKKTLHTSPEKLEDNENSAGPARVLTIPSIDSVSRAPCPDFNGNARIRLFS